MNVISFIFARGGSKGIKNKNIKNLINKPLIAYSIQKSKKIKKIKEIIVSTDSKKIKKISEFYGAKVPFLRPKILAQDTAPELYAWKHAVKKYHENEKKKIDVFISLPTTAPLIKAKTILKALNFFIKNKKRIDLLISIVQTNHYPEFNMVMRDKHGRVKLLKKNNSVYQRQKIKNIYNITTGFYITSPKYITKCKNNLFSGKVYGYEIDKFQSIDIDDIYDFKIAESLIKYEK